jgi:CRP/FNR family transcriptional regulator, cyclic AMP receptor protein
MTPKDTDWGLLAGLGEAERAEVLAMARRRTFRRNEVVVHRGDPADTVHLVVRGRFAVRIVTPLGDTATLAVLGRGDTFGELTLVGGESRRTATVAALEAGETRSLHQHDFDALRRRHPQATAALVDVLAGQVTRLSRLLVEALYLPAEHRVIARIEDLAALYAEHEAQVEVEIPLTQEDIAGLAGTARATVNRVLRSCEERGLVRLRRGRTVVLDRAAFAARSRSLV